jgi:hypothetical protein
VSRLGAMAVREAADPAAVGIAAQPVQVFADCRAALETAWERGLARDVPVRTTAPAIWCDGSIACLPIGPRLSADGIRALEVGLHEATDDIWHSVRDALSGDETADDTALVAARALVGHFQSQIFSAAALEEDDFARPSAIVAVHHADAELRGSFYLGAAPFLAGSGKVTEFEVPAASVTHLFDPEPPAPSLLVKLRNGRVNTLRYRLALKCGQRRSAPPANGTILILRDNELLRDTAVRLAARGFALRRFNLPAVGPRQDESGELVAEVARQAVARRFAERLCPTVVHRLAREAGRCAAADVARYRAAIEPTERALDALAKQRCRAVLSNMLARPETAALHRVLRRRNIPLVTFQHGVTAEITEHDRGYELVYENLGSDLAVTFNEPMAALCRNNSYGGGEAVAAGLPGEYRRLARRSQRPTSEPVLWYLSTSLHQGNVGRLHRGINDIDMALQERALVRDVFARVPRRIVIKPYPVVRYLDPDPVLGEARALPNVEVYEGRLDFRYVARRAGLLLTRGATSTLSWCLASDRPLLFINSSRTMPLRPDLVAPVGAAIFLFDGDAADFCDRLREFLRRPFDAIIQDWEDRAAARRSLMQGIFSTPDPDPGASAADAIVARLAPEGPK